MVLSLVEPYDGLRRPMRVSGAPMSDRVNCIFPTNGSWFSHPPAPVSGSTQYLFA